MLIPSCRHRAEDLRLWAELEAADAACSCTMQYGRTVARTLGAIKRYVELDRRHYVSVSWGKDSVALADMWLQIEPTAKFIYVRMIDNENPDSVAVRNAFLSSRNIDYEEIAYSYQNAPPDWYDAVGKPIHWYQVLDSLQKKFGAHVTGIRRDESSRREKRYRSFGMETNNSFAPLSLMRAADVFAYLNARKLPVHPVYAMLGGGRWERSRIRTASIGNCEGVGMGRREWEREYYPDVLRRIEHERGGESP